ncbi:phosphatidylinositol-glycan biosynthesis class S protein [Naematelia encephala]|uniref:Phosphatidylinositol-glycan biosynthesis class S protein n=1 Tax=Naematelia encephala TaxID=71784 RepID=A0A1Y2B1T5_9TREE|nr:phosphatidylinositol-glycan biosynthesis class S protein [Naematelia encephala]
MGHGKIRPDSTSQLHEQLKSAPIDITKRLNPSSSQRLVILLSFPLLILLAVPFWWYTTSIERLPLPTDRIALLDTARSSLGQKSTILFTADDDAFPKPPPGKAAWDKIQAIETIAEEVTKGVDGIYNQQRPDVRGKRSWDLVWTKNKRKVPPLRVHFRRWDDGNPSFPLEPYIQASEAGFTADPIPLGTLVVPVHRDQLNDRFLRNHYKIALVKSIMAFFESPEKLEIPLHSLAYKPNITLSFVLLNEDASSGGYVRSWDIEGAVRDHIIPHLTPLKQVFNFTIESQLLYHAPLSFEPQHRPTEQEPGEGDLPAALNAAADGDEAAVEVAKQLLQTQGESLWAVEEEDMKIFVNSERWSLDSKSTNNPVLKFLLFVPSSKHRPMRIAVPDAAQSFMIPQFGAVALLNPPSTASSEATFHLPKEALEGSFHLFTQHLYSLLALPSIPDSFHPSPPPSPLHPPSDLVPSLSPWQVDKILRMRTKENSEEARKTLAGIVRLVGKIKEMKLGAGVRDKVLGAVEKLETMDKTSDPLAAFILSRDAVGLANEAFFDPSMMGLLYFPDEHKFAVYTPLFAPISVPIIVGLLKELIAWRKRRKAKSKLLSEKAGGQKHIVVAETPLENDTTAEVKAPEFNKADLRSGTTPMNLRSRKWTDPLN